MDGEQTNGLLIKGEDIHKGISDGIAKLVTFSSTSGSGRIPSWVQVKALTQDVNDKINEFETNPKLLNSNIQKYIDSLCCMYVRLRKDRLKNQELIDGIGSIFYTLCKIRGYKYVIDCFSSDIYLIPGLIDTLRNNSGENETFILLIWLCNLVLVPFSLNLISSNLSSTILDESVAILERHSNASRNQLVASLLISRLLSRQELIDEGLLNQYYDDIVLPVWNSPDIDRTSSKLGHLITINKFLKRCPDSSLITFTKATNNLLTNDIREIDYCITNSLLFEYSALEMRYTIKVLGKIACIYLSHGEFNDAESVINALLHGIMNLLVNRFDSDLRYAMAKSLSGICQEISKVAINYQEQFIKYMIRQLEIENIDWNTSPDHSSKCDMYSFQPNIRVNFDDISISRFHTILLFMGFVSLRRALPISLVPIFFTVVHRTLFFRQKRQSAVLGGQLRDSSCFVLWSIIRGLNKGSFEILCSDNFAMLEKVFVDVIKVIIFDSDFVMRRCGVAVLQEFIGRHGSAFFSKLGVEKDHIGSLSMKLIELFDYTQISSLTQSYSIIKPLMEIGIDRAIFVNTFLDVIVDTETSYELKKLNAQFLSVCISHHQASVFAPEPDAIHLNSSDIVSKLLNSSVPLAIVIDILPLVEDKESLTNRIQLQLKSLKTDKFKESFEIADGYLKWLCYLASNGQVISADEWKPLFPIVRMYDCKEIKMNVTNFFKLIKRQILEAHYKFTESVLCYILKNNEAVSRSVFHCSSFDDEERNSILQVFFSNKITCETKEGLLQSLNEATYDIPFNDYICSQIVDLLDDYTVTIQGDVGSKVRFAALSFIENKISLFFDHSNCLKSKLLRLSGEAIDKIRVKSFKILVILEDYSQSNLSDNEPVDEYFKKLFSYYKERLSGCDDSTKAFASHFWRGVCFSMAATNVRNSLRNSSFEQFVKFLSLSSNPEREEIFRQLLQLLAPRSNKDLTISQQRTDKMVVAVLNLFFKIFESGISFPTNFNFQLLFVRCYNLHIKTNILRLGILLKIFIYISTEQDVPHKTQLEARKRIISFAFSHHNSQVRLMAIEVLYEVINILEPRGKIIKDLELVDCHQDIHQLKKYISEFEACILNL